MEPKPPIQILAVDDTKENIDILKAMLKKTEWQVVAASNGFDALFKANDLKPDLILLDIMMPDIDGFKVCQKLKDNEATQGIPVIFITAKTDTESIVRGFKTGSVDYITKPFNKSELLARIQTHLALLQSQKELEQKNKELQKALDEIKTLKGIIPICSSCKKIRDDKGYWNQLEAYIENHSDALFSHGICEECSDKLYGDQEWYKRTKELQ